MNADGIHDQPQPIILDLFNVPADAANPQHVQIPNAYDKIVGEVLHDLQLVLNTAKKFPNVEVKNIATGIEKEIGKMKLGVATPELVKNALAKLREVKELALGLARHDDINNYPINTHKQKMILLAVAAGLVALFIIFMVAQNTSPTDVAKFDQLNIAAAVIGSLTACAAVFGAIHYAVTHKKTDNAEQTEERFRHLENRLRNAGNKLCQQIINDPTSKFPAKLKEDAAALLEIHKKEAAALQEIHEEVIHPNASVKNAFQRFREEDEKGLHA